MHLRAVIYAIALSIILVVCSTIASYSDEINTTMTADQIQKLHEEKTKLLLRIDELQKEKAKLISEIDNIDKQLKIIETTSSQNRKVEFSGFIGKGKKVSIKELPDAHSKTIKIIQPDDFPKITIKGVSKSFYLIEYQGTTGYVDKEYAYADSKEAYKYFREEEEAAHAKEIIDFKTAKKDLLIKKVKVKEIDSASGVMVELGFHYLNENKKIKYLLFYVTPYNAVGDKVASSIGGLIQAKLQVTGPIEASDIMRELFWHPVWYNSEVSCIKLNKVEIVYTDGATNKYEKNLSTIGGEMFQNDCRYEE